MSAKEPGTSSEDVLEGATLLAGQMAQEEGRGGSFDGRAKSGDQTNDQALPTGVEETEGHHAGRTVRAHGVDPPARQAGPAPGSARSIRDPSAAQEADLWRGRARAAATSVGHARWSFRKAPGPVHGRDRPGARALRRARASPWGAPQAAFDLPGDDRSGTRARAPTPASQRALWDQTRLHPQAPDPHPHLRRVGRCSPRLL